MVRTVERDPKLSLWMNVLTDVQFWVPVLVLTAGLALLRAIR